MNLKVLSTKPTKKRLRLLLIFSIILLIIIYPLMTYFFMISKYPVGFIESQLSFSGEILKQHYLVTDISLYRIGQLLDYGFMLSYGILFFTISLLIGRKFEEATRWRTIGYYFSIVGILAALLDATENLFILIMLIDPLGFPNIIAILHSVCALIKYICFLSVIGWIIIGGLIKIVKR